MRLLPCPCLSFFIVFLFFLFLFVLSTVCKMLSDVKKPIFQRRASRVRVTLRGARTRQGGHEFDRNGEQEDEQQRWKSGKEGQQEEKEKKRVEVGNMRFVPHRDPALQTSAKPLGPDYCSDSETEASDTDVNSAKNLLSDAEEAGCTSDASSTSDGSRPQETVDTLPAFLSTQGLEKRFQLACSLADSRQLYSASPDRAEDGNYYVEYSRQPDKASSTAANTSVERPEPLTKFFISQFTDERVKRRHTVSHLLKLEEERVRKEEEEKKRKIEEQKRREEAAAQKAREEAERKRLAEQKRREEELRKKQQQEKERQMELKKAEEARLQKQKAEEAAAAAAKQAALEKAKEQASKMVVRPAEIESQYMKYMQDIKDIDAQILQPMSANTELKKAAGSHKRKINPKFGQLTNSQSQLVRITNEIKQLIEQTKVNESVYKWILNFVSDAIISQAETEVSVKPTASVPLAKLTLNLLILFEDLRYFLLAKFYSSCPFLLGYSCSQDTEEGRLRLGWSRDADTGKWEIEEQHNERLCGISTLYSVITRLKLDASYVGYDPSRTKHPLPIKHSWIFLARMVDVPTDQLSETHYAIVGAWWDACCTEFLMAYGRQSQKLLKLVSEQWTSIDGTSSAGKVRLKLLGEEWARGSVQSFPPMEP